HWILFIFGRVSSGQTCVGDRGTGFWHKAKDLQKKERIQRPLSLHSFAETIRALVWEDGLG
ncbi:MAG: hypothetical protein ACRDF4_05560, partial [Rhabdochlamydiaceae bacterium]